MVERIEINTNWIFRDKGEPDWLPATVPGTVHTDLYKNREIPNPFYGCNEKDLQWIGERDWIYKTQFTVDDDFLKNSNISLVFEGLDTYAEVLINGQKVLQANNMHRKWEVDCKNLLTVGNNLLEIHFQSALTKFFEDSLALGYPLPGGRWNFARKAAYHFGWDWGPRFITAGIYKPVYLEGWNNHRPTDIFLSTKSIENNVATLTLSAKVKSNITEKAIVKITDKTTKKILTQQHLSLATGENDYCFDFTFKNPKIWWSNGLGEPHIYDLSIEISTESNSIFTKEIPFGIRTLRTVMEDDSIGKALYVELNGVKVFMKGANYIPQHSFVSEVTTEDYKKVIELAKESNMNMIRVWGGGIYQNDIFYELCNRNGLLVWQDFMFACSMYPSSNEYLENVKQEVVYQVKRLRNHSNIALWCGNNESDEGWHNWGWQKAHKISKKDSATIWEGYKSIFHKILPEAIQQFDPQKFYLPSSPLHGWGRKESLLSGSAHYWGVWWGVQSPEMYLEKVPRFMSEYGLQAMPTMATIREFQSIEEDSLFSNSLKCHQKHPTGYQTIAAYLKMEDLYPKTLEEFVYQSQLVQAKGIGLAIEAHRRAMPRCMGTLYWQLNDCWPVTSWSGTDVNDNWKALQYTVRNLYDDIMVSVIDYKNQLDVYIVSDRLKEVKGKFDLSIIDFSGKRYDLFSKEVVIEANTSLPVLSEATDEFLKGFEKERIMVEAVFTDSKGKKYINQKFVALYGKLKLPKANISYSIEPDDNGYNINIKSDSFASQVYFYLSNTHARFSYNFINILPNESVTIFCQTDLPIEAFKEQLKFMNLK